MNKIFVVVAACFCALLAACSSPKIEIASDKEIIGLQGPIKEVVKVEFEAALSDSGWVAVYPDPMLQTTCFYNEAGTLLEQTNRASARVSDQLEYLILSWLNDQGQLVEQEGGKYGEPGYFKHFYEYDERGRVVRQVRLDEGIQVFTTYDEKEGIVASQAQSLEGGSCMWTRRVVYLKGGLLSSELYLDNNGNKVSELKQNFMNDGRLKIRTLGYWESGVWTEEMTEYAYDEQGRLVQEKTSYVGSDFYVITSYSDFDDWGNWRRSEIQDHLGTPYTFSLRRFSYFD